LLALTKFDSIENAKKIHTIVDNLGKTKKGIQSKELHKWLNSFIYRFREKNEKKDKYRTEYENLKERKQNKKDIDENSKKLKRNKKIKLERKLKNHFFKPSRFHRKG
jgi:hypothetical protein